MRFFSTIVAISSLAVAALAAPGSDIEGRGLLSSCLSKNQAQQVATNFATLIHNYSDTLANESLSTTFHDYSDSVNTLIDSGCSNGPAPLGNATFTTRAAFEKGQSSQPDIPFQQLNIWYNCQTVIIRWRTSLTPEFVTGLIVLETVKAPSGNKYPYVIETVYSEFNSGAWLVDLDVFKPSC